MREKILDEALSLIVQCVVTVTDYFFLCMFSVVSLEFPAATAGMRIQEYGTLTKSWLFHVIVKHDLPYTGNSGATLTVKSGTGGGYIVYIG